MDCTERYKGERERDKVYRRREEPKGIKSSSYLGTASDVPSCVRCAAIARQTMCYM